MVMADDIEAAHARHLRLREALLSAHFCLDNKPAAPLPLNGRSLRDHELWQRFGPTSQTASTSRGQGGRAGGNDDDDDDGLDEWTRHRRRAEAAFGPAYFPDEETIRPDQSWNYVASGLTELPANAVRNRQVESRFTEYPRLRRLLELKQELVDQSAIPPTYLCADLRDTLGPPPSSRSAHPPVAPPFHLASLMPVKYDVVLIDPPLSCYDWSSVPSSSNLESNKTWSWADVGELPISLLAAKESFVFLWVGPGSSDGLERGRETLARWGYRRCEVITWCITSPDGKPAPRIAGEGGVLATSAVHCLMGMRGTVRRSKDGNFVHCNVDTDVLFWDGESSVEGGPIDLRRKPPELYSIIENFCQGTRRIELFGTNRNLRRGWLTVGLPAALGPDAPGWVDGSQAEEYVKTQYDARFKVDPVGCPLGERRNVVPTNDGIESLRPRTPPVQPSQQHQQHQPQQYPGHGLLGEELEQAMAAGLNLGYGYRGGDEHAHLPRGLGVAANRAAGASPRPIAGRASAEAPYAVAASQFAHGAYSSPPAGVGSPTTGLGAGGPVRVSVESGSETLSGPQRSAIGIGHRQRGGSAHRGRGGAPGRGRRHW